jgi:hypothetical protein
MATVTLDPRATAALDQRGLELLRYVTRIERNNNEKGWEPDIRVKATIAETDIIGDVDYGLSTGEGKRISLEFSHEHSTYAIGESDYCKVDELIIAVFKNRELRALAAEKTVEDITRKWIRQRFRGETEQEFTCYLTGALESQVAAFRVWVPIDQLYVEQPFELGNSRVDIISRELIQGFGAPDVERIRRAEESFGKYQGHAAIVVAAQGDPLRVRELALRAAEKTLAALSLLSPGVFRCTIASAASLWGSKRLRSATTILFADEKLKQCTEGHVGPPPQSQVIDAHRYRTFEPIIRSLHALLLAETSNQLASKLVDALQVYYRGVSSSDAAEKLIYTFVSLEMILLRNANEAVQDNVATRIAFLIGQSVDERRLIISTVKEGYALRSAFVHHGVQVGDTNKADEMLKVAWRALVELLNAPQRFRDVNELIKALEDRKLQ